MYCAQAKPEPFNMKNILRVLFTKEPQIENERISTAVVSAARSQTHAAQRLALTIDEILKEHDKLTLKGQR